MSKEPLLHARTKAQLDLYLARPTHAMLLIGEEGSGKYHVAQWLASESNSLYQTIEAEDKKNTISIAQIRQLYHDSRTGNATIFIIKDAHTMGIEAQNAFLKLLEEPPKNTRFIMTATNSASLLTTIRSRASQIDVVPPNKQQLAEHAKMITTIDQTTLKSLVYSTRQLPGLFFDALLDEDTRSQHETNVTEAKTFYTASHYDRHLDLINHNFDTKWVKSLLDTLVIIVGTLRKVSVSKAQIEKLNNQAKLLEQVSQSIAKNGNLKIHLTKLVEQL